MAAPVKTMSSYGRKASRLTSPPDRPATMRSAAERAPCIATATPDEKTGSMKRAASPTASHPSPQTRSSR